MTSGIDGFQSSEGLDEGQLCHETRSGYPGCRAPFDEKSKAPVVCRGWIASWYAAYLI